MIAKIILVPISIPFWCLGACIWLFLQLLRLCLMPCFFPIFIQVMAYSATSALKSGNAKKGAEDAKKTAGCAFSMIWGWWRLLSWVRSPFGFFYLFLAFHTFTPARAP